MTIKSGTWKPRHDKVVTHWPLPDANGTGEEVWVDKFDGAGNVVGRDRAVDNGGKPVRQYSAPEGWRNIRSFDGSDNYVKVDANGNVVRTPAGQAIAHRPGRTVVENPDGSVTYLDDDYSRYLFAKAHEHVSDSTETPDDSDAESATTGTTAAQTDASEPPDHETEAFRRWQQQTQGGVSD